MGRLRWSGWDGEYKYTPDAKDIEKAQKNARFRQDMSRISGDAASSRRLLHADGHEPRSRLAGSSACGCSASQAADTRLRR